MSRAHEGLAAAVVRPSDFGIPCAQSDQLLLRDSPKQKGESVPSCDLLSLTTAIRRGNSAAFGQFYDLYSFRIYRYLLVLTRGDELAAHEICQAVMIKLARRFEVFDDEARLWKWLIVLAKHAFIDHCRGKSRRDELARASLHSSLDELPGCDSQNSRLSEALHEVLEQLTPDDRELVQAAYVDERPLQELAEQSGLTYKAIESRLARIRKKVKENLMIKLRHENET
jgi:RNA polymerase sigma-70 factor, ECF subfamily